MLVLNVGGSTRTLPPSYEGWDQHLLDIDPDCKPDFCMDAKDMASCTELKEQYDAVHCSHCLEHFYQHDIPIILAGFLYVLKPNGFAEVIVPNITTCINEMLSRSHDINDVWYRVDGHPITFHDTFFGWSLAMKQGKLAYAHKCAFTNNSLCSAFASAGFVDIQIADTSFNLIVKGKKAG